MSVRGLVAAAAIFAALAGAVWWSETRNKKDDPAAAKSDSPKLVTVKEDEATRLEIRQRDMDSPVVLQREKNAWTMTSPKAVATDADAVNDVVRSLTGLTWDRLVEDKVANLGSFGLANPAAQVTVTGKDGHKTTVLFGDDTPTGSAVYAKLEGDPRVFSVSSGTRSNLLKSWRDLRDKRLITSDDTKLSRVELRAGTQTIEFGKSGQNEWQIVKPRPSRADSLRVEDTIRKLHDAKLNAGISDEDEKKYAAGFATGSRAGQVSFTDPSGAQTLEIRKKGEDYYAKSSVVDTVAKVDKEVGEAVAKPLEEFQAKKLFDFGFNEPSKIQVQNEGKVYAFDKSGQQWRSNGKEMDPTSVQSLIDKLRDLQAIKLLDGSIPAPTIELTVVSSDGKRTEKVSIGKASTRWLARRENDPTIYELDGKKVEELQTAASDVKPPPASSPAPSGRK